MLKLPDLPNHLVIAEQCSCTRGVGERLSKKTAAILRTSGSKPFFESLDLIPSQSSAICAEDRYDHYYDVTNLRNRPPKL